MLKQAPFMTKFINSVAKTLPYLPEDIRNEVQQSLNEFNNYAVINRWSPDDMDIGGKLGLTESEKKTALLLLVCMQDTLEDDLKQVNTIAKEVLNQRINHICVKWDPSYFGGAYSGTGINALVPLDMIKAKAQDSDMPSAVKECFKSLTKQDPIHITNYVLNHVYNQQGEEIGPVLLVC